MEFIRVVLEYNARKTESWCKSTNQHHFLIHSLTQTTIGVQDELLPLVRGMGIDMPSHRARMLYKNKIADLKALCECPTERVVEIMLAGNPYDARAPIQVGKVNVVEEKKKHIKIYSEIVQRMKDRAALVCGYFE